MTDAAGSAQRLHDCPGFLRFWIAATVSGFGTYVTTLAIQVLVVITLHEGAAGVGLVSSARWLPYLLFGLMAGVLVDRSRRRPLLVTTDLGRGALLVAIPLLAGADVKQCRTEVDGVITGDTCPRAGGLDQDIYGDLAP